jgi:hypothetical protein
MKSRQLANVLLKILGTYICLLAIPSCVSGILYEFLPPGTKADTTGMALRMVSYAIGAGVQAAIGIVIIACSSKIAGWMFKEDE